MILVFFQQQINRPLMPYRRLPNTDAARMKALKAALDKGKTLPPFNLSFSQHSLRKLQAFTPTYEQALVLQKQSFEQQIKKNNLYKEALQKARLYISHFIQVTNLAIIRGEFPLKTRKYFGLGDNSTTLPSLKTEKEVIEIGEQIINGETERIRHGVTCVTNPTIAVVKVRYELFLDAYNYQKTLQKKNKLLLEKLANLRNEANQIILQIWNEVEDSYKDLPEDMKREKASQYGLAYVYRKNELQKVRFMETNQKDIG